MENIFDIISDIEKELHNRDGISIPIYIGLNQDILKMKIFKIKHILKNVNAATLEALINVLESRIQKCLMQTDSCTLAVYGNDVKKTSNIIMEEIGILKHN